MRPNPETISWEIVSLDDGSRVELVTFGWSEDPSDWWDIVKLRYVGQDGIAQSREFWRAEKTAKNYRSMRDLIVRLHVEEILSEGQAAKAIGVDRVELRRLADECFDATYQRGHEDGRREIEDRTSSILLLEEGLQTMTAEVDRLREENQRLADLVTQYADDLASASN